MSVQLLKAVNCQQKAIDISIQLLEALKYE